MSTGTDFLPIATGAGALVDSQGSFSGSGYQTQGFQVGIAQPAQANKAWRQASIMAAALANFISNKLNIYIADDGNLTNLITNLTNAIRNALSGVLVVTFNPTPIFDASQSNTFEMTLTGNVTGGTLINMIGGQPLTFIIHQDGTGGRTFVPPSNLPMATIDPGASKTSVQTFAVSNSGTIYPSAPMTSS
jgi:hypothetical protein